MRCGGIPILCFLFSPLLSLIFLCFSRITWAMGVFNFFSERFCFIFCFFHVHEDASRFIVRSLINFSFLRFWDVIIWLGDFFLPILGTKSSVFYPFFVDHDEVKIQYGLFSRVYWCGVATKGCRVRTDNLVRRKHWETSSIRVKDCDRRYIPQVSSAPILFPL